MTAYNDHHLPTGGLSLPTEELSAHRQSLALTALSRLAEQFASRPGFGPLVEALVLTLSGQFSVPNAFALVQLPSSHEEESQYFGTGKLRNHEMLSTLELTHEHRDYFQNHAEPQRVEHFNMSDDTARLGFCLVECEISVLVPLVHSQRLIGIIGLGEKATRKQFVSEDMELLTAMVTSLSPFMANAYLFEEMSEMRRWYLEILNSVRQGVFVFNRFYQLTKINHAGYQILRTLKPRLPGPESLNHVPLDWIFPDMTFKGWAARLLEARKQHSRKKIKGLVATKGTYKRIFTVQVTDIQSGLSEDGDFIVTLDDITNTVENERRMFDLERFADKGVMASSIAHELNNFLGLISGGIELAEMRLSEGDLEKASSTFKQVKEQVAMMTRFTGGLMDYGKLETSKAPGDLNAILSNVLSFVSVQRRFSEISIKTDLHSALPEFEFDSDQISQLLLNLLNNAADSIQQDHPEPGIISVSTAVADGSIQLTLTDNGVGIEPEVLPRLFKAHLTTKESGHGYGLMTCAKILKNHNAEVEVTSDVGQGATFDIKFQP